MGRILLSLPGGQRARRVGVGMALGLFLWALAQVESYPPDFGPYEGLRQQAHAQCQAYQAQGAEAYFMCLQQVAVAACYSPRNPMAQIACELAATAGYPFPGRPVLTAQGYRVEIAGGFSRERHPITNQILRETPQPPRVFYTLQRVQNGLYRGVTYNEQGQPESTYWVTPACEIAGRNGQPAMDGALCPIFPEKPYLLKLLFNPSISPVPVPSPVVYKGGRLADDFDRDGVVEIGYLNTVGGSGRDWASGGVEAFGYDPNTKRLKFRYVLFGNQGGSAGNFLREILVFFQVR